MFGEVAGGIALLVPAPMLLLSVLVTSAIVVDTTAVVVTTAAAAVGKDDGGALGAVVGTCDGVNVLCAFVGTLPEMVVDAAIVWMVLGPPDEVTLLGVVNGTAVGTLVANAVGECAGELDGGSVSPQLIPKKPVAQMQL